MSLIAKTVGVAAILYVLLALLLTVGLPLAAFVYLVTH